MPVDLRAVRRFYVTPRVLTESFRFLQDQGRTREAEGSVLWAGNRGPSGDFTIDFVIVPTQNAFSCSVGIPVESLHSVFRQLHREGKILAAQVHSHPDLAFHSEVDEDFPIVTKLGSLSIVVPNYGFGGPNRADGWAVHRLHATGWSDRIPVGQILVIEAIEEEEEA